MKRLGIIETWNDRKIGPGDEWKKEIDERLYKADVILLLISADFLASEYCYGIEGLNALDRHAREQAIVIPVVLRPVDFHGLPIERLQMLPKDAVAVTSKGWTTQDEALKNIAEGIREAVDRFLARRSMLRELEAQPTARLEPRCLDASIAGEIPVNATRQVVALVRLKDSKGLTSILPEERSPASVYSSIASEVRSEAFNAKFVVGSDGMPTSPSYRLSVDAPDLVVLDSDKHFSLEWGYDSITFTFFVKAEQPGEQHLRVNLFSGHHQSAEVLLKTHGVGETPPSPGGFFETLVSSVKLRLNVFGQTASAFGG